MPGADIPFPVLLVSVVLSLLLAWLSGTLAGTNMRACRALGGKRGIFLEKCMMITYATGCLQTVFAGISMFFMALSIGNTDNSTWEQNCEMLTFSAAIITAGGCLFVLLWSSMMLDRDSDALRVANMRSLPGEIQSGSEVLIRKILRGLRYLSFLGMIPFLITIILICLISGTESEDLLFSTSVMFFYAATLRFVTAMGRVSFIAFRRAEKRTRRTRLKSVRDIILSERANRVTLRNFSL